MTEYEMRRQEELEAIMAYVGETEEGWKGFTEWVFRGRPLAWEVAQATQTGPELRSDKTFIELGRALCRTVEDDMWEYVEENFYDLRAKALNPQSIVAGKGETK